MSQVACGVGKPGPCRDLSPWPRWRPFSMANTARVTFLIHACECSSYTTEFGQYLDGRCLSKDWLAGATIAANRYLIFPPLHLKGLSRLRAHLRVRVLKALPVHVGKISSEGAIKTSFGSRSQLEATLKQRKDPIDMPKTNFGSFLGSLEIFSS